MARKYKSTLTAAITPDNWKDSLNLPELSLDDLTDLVGDFKQMEKLGKQLAGYLKEAITARMPEGETEYSGPHFMVQFNERCRAGALDEAKCLEDMGEDWIEDHRKDPIEYTEMRVTPVLEE